MLAILSAMASLVSFGFRRRAGLELELLALTIHLEPFELWSLLFGRGLTAPKLIFERNLAEQPAKLLSAELLARFEV